MAGLHFEFTGDNSSLMKSFNEIQTRFEQTQSLVESSGGSIEDIFNAISNRISSLGDNLQTESSKLKSLFNGIPKLDLSFLNDSTDLEAYGQAMSMFSKVIRDNEVAISELSSEFDRLLAEEQKLSSDPSQKEYLSELQKQRSVIFDNLNLRKQVIEESKKWIQQLEDSANKISAYTRDVNAETKADRESTNAIEGKEKATSALRGKIRALTMEAAELRAAAQAEGVELDKTTGRYREIIEELGRLKDIQGDIAKAGSILANDENKLAGIMSGLSGITGGFTAAQGAMALFTGENEDLQMIMTKLQAVMAITIGLQQVQQMLNKDSAFSLVTLNSLKTFWNKITGKSAEEQTKETIATSANTVAKNDNTATIISNTTAEIRNTSATGAQTVAAKVGAAANFTLAGAFKAVGAAIKSIPVFGWIVAGISTLVGAISIFSSKAEKAKEDIEEFKNAVSEAASDPIAKIEQLSIKWSKLGDNLDEKKRFIEENKKAFEDLGVSINNVADAENVLINNKDKFIQAQISKAQASVYSDMAKKQIEELIKKEGEFNLSVNLANQYSKLSEESNFLYLNSNKANNYINDANELYDEIQSLRNGINSNISKAIDIEQNAINQIKNLGIESIDIMETSTDAMLSYIASGAEGAEEKIREMLLKIKEVGGTVDEKIEVMIAFAETTEGDSIEKRASLAKKMYNEAKNNLVQLQKNESTATLEEIEKQKEKISELSNLYKKLTGKEIESTGFKQTGKSRAKLLSEADNKYLTLLKQIRDDELALEADTEKKRKEQILNQYKDRLKEIDKLETELLSSRKKAGLSGLSSDDEAALADARLLAENRYVEGLRAIAEKEIQYKYDYLKSYGSYQEKRFAIEQEYNKKIRKAMEDGLNEWQVEALKKERDNALSNLDESESKYMTDYLKEYGTFEEKRLAITKEYNQKIEKAQNEWERKSLEQQKNKDLENLNVEELKKSINWEEVFGNMDYLSKSSLESLRSKLQETLKTISDPKAAETIINAIKNIDKELANRNPFLDLQNSVINLISANQNLKIAQEAYNKALAEGNEEEIIAAKATLNSAKDTKRKALVDATNSLQASVSKTKEYLGIATTLTETLEKLGVDVPEQLSGFISGMGDVLEGLGSINLTNPVSVITGGIKAIGGLIKGIGSLFNNDSKHEKNIQRIQEQIDALQKSYSKLGNEIEKSYSKDASKLIKDQNELLKQQKILIQKQIDEEQAKKHTDDSKIEAWREQIEDINKLINDNKEASIDAIFGQDLKSAIEKFADTYANAWSGNEDRAKSAKETVKKMMQSMVQESIKAAVQSSGKIDEIREKLKEFYADNVLTEWEQDYIYQMAQSLQEDLDRQFGWAESLMNTDDKTSTQTATSGYSTSLSEDTGSELVGRATATYLLVDSILSVNTDLLFSSYAICEQMKRDNMIRESLNNNVAEIRDYQLLLYNTMDSISKNTKSLQTMDERLEKIEKNTR